jgi:CRP/FNR family transcriptional regulator
MFRPGSFFPLMSVLGESKNEFTFEAISTAAVFMRKRAHIREFLTSNPDVLLDVTERLLSGMEGLLHRLTLLSTQSAYERVTSLLVYVARSIGVSEPEGVRIPIFLSHKDIASWVGTTRETVSLQMETLKKYGRIYYAGRTLFIRNH